MTDTNQSSAGLLPLSAFYKGWDVYQQHLVTAISPLTAEQLTLQSAPHMWSVGTLATHVIVTRVGWFHYWMGEGDVALRPIGDWDEEGQPLRSAAELVDGLNLTWQMIDSALSRWTAADLDQMFESPFPRPPSKPRVLPRQWIIWHVLEHDMHHGGEISLVLGTHKIPAIDL